MSELEPNTMSASCVIRRPSLAVLDLPARQPRAG